MRHLVIFSLILAPVTVHAQAAGNSCIQANTYFAFQVDRAATWIPDTMLTLQPTPTINAAKVRVSFVVDTAGRPVMSSLKVIMNRDGPLASRARGAIAHWKFYPAVRDGCLVAQLVFLGVEARPGG